jgi:hypothetical protein
MPRLHIATSGRLGAASLLVCLLCVAACCTEALCSERSGRLRAAGTGQSPAWLFRGSETGLGTLYPTDLEIVQRYVASMTLYRLAPAEDGLKASVLALDWVGTDRLPEMFRLVWSAPNRNLVARIGKGLFRISSGNYRANWFNDLDCRLVNWSNGEAGATVSCADGKDRRMLVPGTGVLVIDNEQYQRMFPMDEETGPKPELRGTLQQ